MKFGRFSYMYISRQQSCRCIQTESRLGNADIRARRKELFGKEKNRQLSLVKRIEKIVVEYVGLPEQCKLMMNKNVSTPYNCTMHMKSNVQDRAVLSIVSGQSWDMHRPLEEDCTLNFLNFQDQDPTEVNKAFWRTCSFLLGYALEHALKDEYTINLIRFPYSPIIEDGFFCYDVDLGKLQNWEPKPEELRSMSRIVTNLGREKSGFERLEVNQEFALDMFKENEYKCEEIKKMATKSFDGSHVTLYKLNDHIDAAEGPLIGSTQFLNRFDIVKFHKKKCPVYGNITSVQGVGLPSQLSLHYKAYELLMERASNVPYYDPFRDKSTDSGAKTLKAIS